MQIRNKYNELHLQILQNLKRNHLHLPFKLIIYLVTMEDWRGDLIRINMNSGFIKKGLNMVNPADVGKDDKNFKYEDVGKREKLEFQAVKRREAIQFDILEGIRDASSCENHRAI